MTSLRVFCIKSEVRRTSCDRIYCVLIPGKPQEVLSQAFLGKRWPQSFKFSEKEQGEEKREAKAATAGFWHYTLSCHLPWDVITPIYRWTNWCCRTWLGPFGQTLQPMLFPPDHTVCRHTRKHRVLFLLLAKGPLSNTSYGRKGNKPLNSTQQDTTSIPQQSWAPAAWTKIVLSHLCFNKVVRNIPLISATL